MATERAEPAVIGEGGRAWLAEVVVLPKEGVNDPQGEAIRGGLAMLGHREVREVRSGRFVRLTLAAPDAETARADVGAMCEQLLANTVIESYVVTITEIAPDTESEDSSR